MKQEYYAHIRPDPEEPEKVDYQTVKDHLLGTAERCAAFAGAFQAEQAGRAVGSCSRLSAWPGTTAGWRMWVAKGTGAVPPCLPA